MPLQPSSPGARCVAASAAPDAAAWRGLLLHFHDEYLNGAKAPDNEFKDFKNHVLHVRDEDWGGAVEACEEWYRRLMRALREEEWKHAAWSAGVLSHYYVDPCSRFTLTRPRRRA